MRKDEIAKHLLEIILDKNAEEADRDDALIDLRDYEYPHIETAII